VRARVSIIVLSFCCALAAAGTPASIAAAAERAPALGGEPEQTPYVASHQFTVASTLQLRAARESSARPAFWKLPPHTLTLRVVATLVPSVIARATEVACAPIAPPSAPRSCRGPPGT
jgi:hypothetical protein